MLNLATKTFFNNDLVGFVMGRTSAGLGNFGFSAGVSTISFRELFDFDRTKNNKDITLGGQIKENLENNWMAGVGGALLIPLAFKFGKGIGRPTINRTNRMLKTAGIASTVKL